MKILQVLLVLVVVGCAQMHVPLYEATHEAYSNALEDGQIDSDGDPILAALAAYDKGALSLAAITYWPVVKISLVDQLHQDVAMGTRTPGTALFLFDRIERIEKSIATLLESP